MVFKSVRCDATYLPSDDEATQTFPFRSTENQIAFSNT